MRATIQIKSLALGALLAAVAIFTVAAATTRGAVTWEYRFLEQHRIVLKDKPPSTGSENLELLLNRTTKEGWEVVGHSDGPRGLCVLLRRVKM